MKKVKILLITMLFISVLYFWYCYNTATAINMLQTLKSFTKADPLWWARDLIGDIVDFISGVLRKMFGLV